MILTGLLGRTCSLELIELSSINKVSLVSNKYICSPLSRHCPYYDHLCDCVRKNPRNTWSQKMVSCFLHCFQYDIPHLQCRDRSGWKRCKQINRDLTAVPLPLTYWLKQRSNDNESLTVNSHRLSCTLLDFILVQISVHFLRILQWWGKTAKGPIILALLPGQYAIAEDVNLSTAGSS